MFLVDYYGLCYLDWAWACFSQGKTNQASYVRTAGEDLASRQRYWLFKLILVHCLFFKASRQKYCLFKRIHVDCRFSKPVDKNVGYSSVFMSIMLVDKENSYLNLSTKLSAICLKSQSTRISASIASVDKNIVDKNINYQKRPKIDKNTTRHWNHSIQGCKRIQW